MATTHRSESLTIAAPPSAVFDILADPRQHPRIDGSGSVRGSVSGPERLSLGAEFGMDMKLGASYQMTNKVVEFEPDRLIAWRHRGLHRWRYELSATDDGGTRVTETWDLAAYNPVLRLGFNAVLGSRTQRAMAETLRRLRDAAEADADADADADG